MSSSGLRRGIHTIEVQAPIVASLGAWAASAAQVIPPRYAVYLTAVSVFCIALSRGLAKLGDPALNGNAVDHLISEGVVSTKTPPGN